MTIRAGLEGGIRRYETEYLRYSSNRKIIGEYAKWIEIVPWQQFCTFTFAWKVSDQEADDTFADFINQLEQTLRCDVSYVRGAEKRFSGCGKPACGRHFHTLLTSAAPMSPILVQELWTSMAGRRSDNAGAQVEVFDPEQNGVSYVLKLINQVDGDWDFRNLHLFTSTPPTGTLNSRQRRHLRRHAARTEVHYAN